MSDITKVAASNAAMEVAVAVAKANEKATEDMVAMLVASQAVPDGRAPLPYSQVLDKLA